MNDIGRETYAELGIIFGMRRWLLIIQVCTAAVCFSCDSTPPPNSTRPESPPPPMSATANQALLDEANATGNWFHAKKTRPIWAKRLDAAQTVQTLEGEEQVAAGHYLCRGEAGDIWPQTEETLLKRYTATDEVNDDGWRRYQPHADAQGVMATPIDHPFEVHASWGTLRGKAGDYLLKNFQDREMAYPKDVWIVDQQLFGETYEAMSSK
jgi:hypothetical protein